MKIGFGLYSDMMETVTFENGIDIPMSIQRVQDGDDPDLDFRSPRYIGKVRSQSMAQPGAVIDYLGEKYILTQRAKTPDYRTFWLFKADRLITWKRPGAVVDAVTGLTRSTTLTTMGTTWASWEIMSRQPIDRQLGISNEVSRLIVTVPVQLNDVLDGQQVKRVNDSMGVRILEVQ